MSQGRAAIVDSLTDVSNCLRPPSGPALALYIEQAAAALGTNEAGLARTIGVSRATVSSWKKRGSLTEPNFVWFKTALPEKIVIYRRRGNIPVSVEARLAFLDLVRRTEGKPFASPSRPPLDPMVEAERIYGIMALAEFIWQRVLANEGEASPHRVADMLQGTLWLLRGSDASDFQ